MYRNSFPKCEVLGEWEPVEFGHMASHGAVPKKCSSCSNLFEGECMRRLDDVDSLLRLDYDSCGKTGSSQPIEIEVINENSIFVPEKCLHCEFLGKSDIHGHFCKSENDKWGDFPRDLDWGDWKPDYSLIGHRRYKEGTFSKEDLGPAIITRELILLLMKNEKTKAVVLYRKLNQVEYIKEAAEVINILLDKLKKNKHITF